MVEPVKPRVLVFVVAYNAENTIEKVLNRIPDSLSQYDTEILVIDDASQDATFERAREAERRFDRRFKLVVLANPVNQGYGGNQKIGYQYAIRHGFDVVVLLHGDGQYAPEKLPELISLLFAQQAAAVFGSRMMVPLDALRGGMPLYKWLGNRVLTGFQNLVLGQQLSEFHSGYRAYRVASLAQLPFALNTRNFHFDTEIIIQLVLAGMKIVEHPIPTFYGDEISRVNGLQYAWNVVKATVLAKLQRYGIFYQRRFDVAAVAGDPAPVSPYRSKLGFLSTHSMALAAVPDGAAVMDIGSGGDFLAPALVARGCTLTAQASLSGSEGPPVPSALAAVTHVLLLDVIEHASQPERFLQNLYAACGDNYRLECVASTGNVAFLPVRLALLLGGFRYGRRGILDLTHKRLFTFASFRNLFEEGGFEVVKVVGVPAPFPLALGDTALARALLWLNTQLIRLSKGLFAYQIFLVARPLPSVDYLLERAILKSGQESA